ncbi:hypothetical protein [Brucella endophytica]|nr:hypothetical protein [Brucella endophytica]
MNWKDEANPLLMQYQMQQNPTNRGVSGLETLVAIAFCLLVLSYLFS